MLAPTRSPRSRPHGASGVIWCTRAETSPAAAASVRTETPSARAEASAQRVPARTAPGATPPGIRAAVPAAPAAKRPSGP